eukprot:COSAG05_NODE_7456_length_809_cov_1.142254_2_plen_126_part_01
MGVQTADIPWSTAITATQQLAVLTHPAPQHRRRGRALLPGELHGVHDVLRQLGLGWHAHAGCGGGGAVSVGMSPGHAGGPRPLTKRRVIEARWGSKPLASAGQLRPQRLNNQPLWAHLGGRAGLLP